MRIEPGDRLRDRFRIVRGLGGGGQAQTFQADDQAPAPGGPARVVVKMLDLRDAGEWKSVDLIEREAKVLRSLRHPDVPAFVDFFRDEEPDAVRLTLVQEYVDGESLRDRLRARGRLPEREAIDIGIHLAGVLEYLHGLAPPVIHRDIKPSNVVIDPSGRAHLVDFGAVRDALRPPTVTPEGGDTVVGTYGYMPVEQFAGHAVPATDLYALGVMLAELLTGIDPARLPRARGRILVRKAVRASAGMLRILEALTEPALDRRLASARVLHEALEALRGGRPLPASLPGAAAWSRRRWLAIAAGLAAIFALAHVATHAADYFGAIGSEDPPIRDETACGAPVRPAVAIGRNLVTNPGLEGPCGWVLATRAGAVLRGSAPHAGGGHFVLRREGDRIWQVIDVSPLAGEIRSGNLRVTASAALRAAQSRFTGAPYLWLWAMRTENDYEYLSGFPVEESTSWTVRENTWDLPAGTRAIRVELSRAARAGDFFQSSAAHFDDVSVVVHR